MRWGGRAGRELFTLPCLLGSVILYEEKEENMKATRREFVLGSAAIVGSTYVLAGGSVDAPVADTNDMVYVPAGTFTKGLTVEHAADLAKQYDVHPSHFGGESGGGIHIEGVYINHYPVTHLPLKQSS